MFTIAIIIFILITQQPAHDRLAEKMNEWMNEYEYEYEFENEYENGMGKSETELIYK